jgi:SSS family solute:Na+ symporter
MVASRTLWLLLAYGIAAITVAFLSNRRRITSTHYLHTGRDLPLWIVSLSFLAANCNALEVMTMVGISAGYGVSAVHFYWIGAIPALLFLLWCVLPVYQRSGVRSVPEYLERRFTPGARAVSALLFVLMMIAIAGINICLFSRLAHFSMDWSLGNGIWIVTVLACVFLSAGGLTAVMRSEAVQLLIFLLVLVPVSVQVLQEHHGLMALVRALPEAKRHTFVALPLLAPHMPLDGAGTLVGLGCVLGFSYWCGDVLLVQRLLAARNTKDMNRIPALAMVFKILLPFVLVVPGLAVLASGNHRSETFDLVLPELLMSHYSPAWVGIALAALLASLFAGLVGNLAAAVSMFTHDLYRPFLHPGKSDAHYLQVSRLSATLFSVLAALAAYGAFPSQSLMEYIQAVLGILNVPLASALLMGAFTPVARRSAVPAMLAGVGVGVLHAACSHWLGYGSGLASSFYGAILSATVTVSVAVGMSVTGHETPVRTSGSETEQNQAVFLLEKPTRYVMAISAIAMITLYTVFR